tara:strand:+ start:447 stop:881 length:435 start_codon:yes stop_codon:yes gene_type:complete
LVEKNKNVIMALQGNCIHTEFIDSGETEIVTGTNPDGSTVEIEQPIMNKTETEYNDVYVIVKQVEFFQTYYQLDEEVPNNSQKVQAVLFQIAGYESKEARDANQENWLFWEPMQLNNYDYNLNLLSQCYNLIKQTQGYTELENI